LETPDFLNTVLDSPPTAPGSFSTFHFYLLLVIDQLATFSFALKMTLTAVCQLLPAGSDYQ